jgi:Carboxypeptidase regulatory-like domain
MNHSSCSTLSLRSLLWLACLFALSASSAFAQLSSATLSGVVRDSTGAVIAKASLILANVDTGIERPGSSNESGNYVFADITPGRYTLKTSAQGFSTKQVSAFVLAVNQTATIDVVLAPGAQTEVVTVDAAGEQLQTSTAELGTVIATHQVNDLPLNGRNFTQLLSLTPGVSPISVGQNNMGGRTGGFAAPIAEGAEFTFPSVNGATNRSNYFLTDGMSNFAAFLSTYAVPPIIDAIQEFKVVSRTDTAEFGSVLGGVINVVTKSGTNQFHGGAWEYIRNNAFDAAPTNPNFLAAGAKVPSFHQNQFGASIGGPVAIPTLKNNTFFYFAYQGFRFSQPSSSNILVPTAAQLTGDFSGICATGFTGGICNDRDSKGNVIDQIYNPFTTTATAVTPATPTGFTRQPFAGNIITPGLIDPRLVGFIQSVYPAAGQFVASTNSNAIDTDPNTQHQNEYNVRLDHTFGQKDSIWFRYSRIDSTVSVPAGLPGLIKNEAIPGRDWGGSYVHTFSPSLQLEGLFSRTTVSDDATTKFAKLNSQTVDQAAGFSPDFASNFAGTPGWLIPSLGPGNNIASAGESVQNTPQATDNWQYSVTMTKVKGTHTFKVGANYVTSRFSSPISYDQLGFATTQTNDANGNGGFGLASTLLGVVDNANRRDVNEATRQGGLFSTFFQDSWKASPRLTINYGVRYDLTLIPPYGTLATIGQQGGIETGEPNYSDGTYVLQYPPPPCTVRGIAPCIPSIALDASGNAIACDPTTQTCLPPGTLPPHVVVDNRGRISHNTYTNIGPHFGFAYRIGEKTVVRGSTGVVYDNWAAVSQMSQNIEGDWPGIGQLIATSVNAPGTSSAPTGPPTVFAQNPFLGNGTAGLPGPTPFSASNVNWYYDPHIKNAYAYQYNFGIQRQLNSSTTLTASYVGSSTRRANIGGAYNTALNPSPAPNPAARTLFPYMVTSFYDRSNGFGDYNAFQLQLDKRFNNGLAYQVAYTFSKALTENDGWFGAEGKNVANPYDPRASLSPAGYNLPHILTANVVYQLPFGANKKFATSNHAVDAVIGNWQVNSIFTIRSGQAYSVIDGVDQANTGNTGWAGYEQANLVGDPNTGSCPNGAPAKSRTCYFNTNAFAVPTLGTYGNVRPEGFQQQRYWNVDMSIFRQFPLWSESRRLEFRAESFNLFNTTILGTPGGDVNSPGSLGIVTGAANQSRQLQFGLKFIF